MRKTAEETRLYEGMFLIRNKQAKDDYEAVMKELTGFIQEAGGTIINSAKWDERKLAYDIGGERRGTYIMFHFEAKPEIIVRIERSCQISDTVLRSLIVRDTDGKELPPPGMGIGSAKEAAMPEMVDSMEDSTGSRD